MYYLPPRPPFTTPMLKELPWARRREFWFFGQPSPPSPVSPRSFSCLPEFFYLPGTRSYENFQRNYGDLPSGELLQPFLGFLPFFLSCGGPGPKVRQKPHLVQGCTSFFLFPAGFPKLPLKGGVDFEESSPARRF